MNAVKKVLIAIVRLCIWGPITVILLTALWIFIKQIYPTTRTQFRSYEAFVKATEWTCYAPRLPESAHDCYEGGFSDKNGFYAKFSKEDYEYIKLHRLESYNLDFVRTYHYDGINKVYLDQDKLKDLRVDYLDELLPENSDMFYILVEELLDDSDEVYHYEAIFCNDETCEMIEISCRIWR